MCTQDVEGHRRVCDSENELCTENNVQNFLESFRKFSKTFCKLSKTFAAVFRCESFQTLAGTEAFIHPVPIPVSEFIHG